MRSRHLFGLLLSTLTIMAASSMGTGCGDGGDGDPTGSGGSGASGGAGGSGASGGAGGGNVVDNDGNTSCDTAEVLDLYADAPLTGKLDPVAVDRDYYKVDLLKGQAIYLGTIAKPEADPYDETYPDTVITLYGPDGKTQIAQNDDMSSGNDSELLYLVPEDGTYCLEVTECGIIFGEESCAPAADIVNVDYELSGFEFDPMGSLITVDTEPNETPAQATPVKKVSFPNGGPVVGYQSIGWGTFGASSDQDIYSFKVENDVQVDANARALCVIEFQAPPGPNGSGSTAMEGVIARIAEAATPNVTLAQTDMTVLDYTFGYEELPTLTVPCDKGKDYLLFLSRPAGAVAGANDFYFYSHYQYGSNPAETEPNNATAQPLELSPTSDMSGYVAAVTGNIGMPGANGDIDLFSVQVPAGMGLASALCTAERSGSGLRGLQVSLLDQNDNFLKNGTAAEGVDHQLFVDSAFIAAGTTTVKMRVIADSQDANVTGTYYYCSLILLPQ